MTSIQIQSVNWTPRIGFMLITLRHEVWFLDLIFTFRTIRWNRGWGRLAVGLFSLSQSEHKSDKPRVSAKKSSDCKKFNDVRLKKKWLRKKGTRKVEDCARHCYEKKRCKVWTFIRSKSVCILGKTLLVRVRFDFHQTQVNLKMGILCEWNFKIISNSGNEKSRIWHKSLWNGCVKTLSIKVQESIQAKWIRNRSKHV